MSAAHQLLMSARASAPPAGSSIVITPQTAPVNANLSLSNHFFVQGNSAAPLGNGSSKAGSVFTFSIFGTATDPNTGRNACPGLGAVTWTDADTGTTSSSVTDECHNVPCTDYGSGIRIVIVAGTSPKTVRIWADANPLDHLPALKIRATLSDGSFAEQTHTFDTAGVTDFNDLPVVTDVTFNCATGTPNMTIQIETVTNANGGSQTVGLMALSMN